MLSKPTSSWLEVAEQQFPGFTDEWDFARQHVGRIESHLEETFLAFWVIKTTGCAPVQYRGRSRSPGLPYFNLRSQVKIGRHRVDFVLDVLELACRPAASAVIEVDGFAYHSSKRSFIADRARDQEITAAGYTVFRFTAASFQERADPLRDLLAWTRRVRPLTDKPGTLGRAIANMRRNEAHSHA